VARIRTIKPEFWSDEKLGPLSPLARLVFLGLVSQADDAGRLLDSPRLLNGVLFPYTEDDCTEALGGLASVGVIARGRTTSGQPIIQIVGWSKHQRIEKPNLRSAYDEIQQSATVPGFVADESPTSHRPDLRSTTDDLRPTTDDRWEHRRDAFLALVPVAYRPDVEALFRSARNPDAILRALVMIVEGGTPPAYDHTTIGRGIQEIAVTGGKFSINGLRAFCHTIKSRKSSVPRGTTTESPGEALIRRAAEQDKAA
jgi:hypothetical protein